MIHAVDLDAVGLGELGRKEGYIERQMKRWYSQWEKSKTRELPHIDEVYQHLMAAHPSATGTPPSSTATTGSTTAWCRPTDASLPSSTGRSARSAIRSPTSAC